MNANDKSGQAFPAGGYHVGMTLRDWFAGQALTGILASHAELGRSLPKDATAARWSYEYADAMLAERALPHTNSPEDEIEQRRRLPDSTGPVCHRNEGGAR